MSSISLSFLGRGQPFEAVEQPEGAVGVHDLGGDQLGGCALRDAELADIAGNLQALMKGIDEIEAFGNIGTDKVGNPLFTAFALG